MNWIHLQKKKGFCRTDENQYIQNTHAFKFLDMNQPNIKIIMFQYQ